MVYSLVGLECGLQPYALLADLRVVVRRDISNLHGVEQYFAREGLLSTTHKLDFELFHLSRRWECQDDFAFEQGPIALWAPLSRSFAVAVPFAIAGRLYYRISSRVYARNEIVWIPLVLLPVRMRYHQIRESGHPQLGHFFK